MPSHCRSSSHSGKKNSISQPTFYFPYHSSFLAELDVLQYGILLVPVWVSCHSFVHYKLLAHPSLLGAGGSKVKKPGSFDTVHVLCNNSQNNCELSTLVLSQNPKCSTTEDAINELQKNLTSNSITDRPGTR